MSDLCFYIDSHVAPDLEGLLPLLCWLYGEKNGVPDKENGLDKPQIWGGVVLYVHYELIVHIKGCFG